MPNSSIIPAASTIYQAAADVRNLPETTRAKQVHELDQCGGSFKESTTRILTGEYFTSGYLLGLATAAIMLKETPAK